MAETTAISWTNATWNPVTGCTKVSPGCENCYAERNMLRWKRGLFTDVTFHHLRLDQPSKWKRPRMIFVCSMGDLFHSDVTDRQIGRIFEAMKKARQHTYQVLTKRPNRVRRWWDWYRQIIAETYGGKPEWAEWPSNIWLGTSVESALYLPRIDCLEGIAPLTFVSAEPLLGPLSGGPRGVGLEDYLGANLVQWVIAGGESGPGSRPMDPAWVREIRDICGLYNTPLHVKQDSGPRPGQQGRIPDDLWAMKEMPA